jgi:hypothetical protein
MADLNSNPGVAANMPPPQSGHTRPNRALMLTQEIAQDAHLARALYRECSDAANDPESAEALIAALNMAICKIGMLADMAIAHLDGVQARGGPEHWMMPDAYLLAGAH